MFLSDLVLGNAVLTGEPSHLAGAERTADPRKGREISLQLQRPVTVPIGKIDLLKHLRLIFSPVCLQRFTEEEFELLSKLPGARTSTPRAYMLDEYGFGRKRGNRLVLSAAFAALTLVNFSQIVSRCFRARNGLGTRLAMAHLYNRDNYGGPAEMCCPSVFHPRVSPHFSAFFVKSSSMLGTWTVAVSNNYLSRLIDLDGYPYYHQDSQGRESLVVDEINYSFAVPTEFSVYSFSDPRKTRLSTTIAVAVTLALTLCPETTSRSYVYDRDRSERDEGAKDEDVCPLRAHTRAAIGETVRRAPVFYILSRADWVGAREEGGRSGVGARNAPSMRLVHIKTMELRAKPRAVASRRDYAPQSLRVLIVRAPNLLPRSLLDRTHAPEPAQHEGTTLWQPSKRRTFNGAANSRLAQRTPLRPSLLVPGVPPSAAAIRAQHNRAFQPSELNRELPRATYSLFFAWGIYGRTPHCLKYSEAAKHRASAVRIWHAGRGIGRRQGGRFVRAMTRLRFECRVDGGAHGFRGFSLATLRTKPVARGLAKPIPLPSATANGRVRDGSACMRGPRARRPACVMVLECETLLKPRGHNGRANEEPEDLQLVRAAQGRVDGVHLQTTSRSAHSPTSVRVRYAARGGHGSLSASAQTVGAWRSCAQGGYSTRLRAAALITVQQIDLQKM
ncbi:hypothetical protein FB451DRAFT_1373727 [Mycena latifolia]|nr:hypothetical protein FB451DRAFT_1373727 [Mycena latifolia]